MKLIPAVLIGVLSCTALPTFAEECEATVDRADSVDFRKMHIECGNDPVFRIGEKDDDSADNTSATETYGENFAEKKPIARDDGQVSSSASPPTQGQVAADNAGVTYNIREPFTLSGGPESALRGLFVQMAGYCPQGWAKLAEWAEPAQQGYHLHFQFRCAALLDKTAN